MLLLVNAEQHGRKKSMSIESRIVELKKRHAALEKEIAAAKLHPSTDTTQLSALKRRKLHLKEEIVRLDPPTHH